MIFINDISNHELHKKTILQHIDEFKSDNEDTKKPVDLYGNAHSDYHIGETKRDYMTYFFDFVEPIMVKVGKDMRLDKFDGFGWSVQLAWFQQYYKGGTHPWHNHPECQFTNIYFVEMPNEEDKTEIIGLNDKLIQYDAKEGQIITFPSFLQHRSNPATSDRKTIISFNTSYSV